MLEMQGGYQSGEDVLLLMIDIQELKCGYQMGVVFPVVHTLTYVYRIGILLNFWFKLTRKYTA